jgi:transposase
MTRLRGRCLKQKRLVAKVPHGRWKTLSFIAALRCDRVTAPCVLDGAVNGRNFLAYVKQVLVPALRPGDVVKIGELLDAFTAEECANYLANSGYAAVST